MDPSRTYQGFNDPFADTRKNAPDDQYPVESTHDYTSVLERIARNLDKNNPSVQATAVIVSGGSQAVWGGVPAIVKFQIDGKDVPVYSVMIFTSATAGVTYNFNNQVANVKDGAVITAASIPLILSDFQAERLGILWAGANGTQLPLNGPADSTLGGLYIYGWTTQEYIGINK